MYFYHFYVVKLWPLKLNCSFRERECFLNRNNGLFVLVLSMFTCHFEKIVFTCILEHFFFRQMHPFPPGDAIDTVSEKGARKAEKSPYVKLLWEIYILFLFRAQNPSLKMNLFGVCFLFPSFFVYTLHTLTLLHSHLNFPFTAPILSLFFNFCFSIPYVSTSLILNPLCLMTLFTPLSQGSRRLLHFHLRSSAHGSISCPGI